MSQLDLETQYIERHLHAVTLEAPTLASSTTSIHPDRMRISIEHVELNTVPSKPITVRLAFRSDNVRTPSMPIHSPDFNQHSYEFPLTYHAILFDKLKVEVLESKILFGNSGLGRCHIKLSKLPELMGECLETFELKRKHHHLNPLHHSTVLGKITLKFTFYGGNMTQIIPPIQTNFDEEQGSSPSSNTSYPSDDFFHYLEEAELEQTKPNISPLFMRHRKDSESSTSSTASILTNCTSGSDRKYSQKSGKIISERTRLGLKEIAASYTAFIGFNSPISKPDIARALLFVLKFFERQPRRHSQPLDIETDASKYPIAHYFLKYAAAAYGPFMINVAGYGRGFIFDKFKGDKKTVMEHLQIKKEDMLIWEYESAEIFKPNFFLCFDPETRALILSVRGTMGLQDVGTDLAAEYEPFTNGYVHRGVLRSGLWILEHHLDDLYTFIQSKQALALYAVGHSLGGAIAALLGCLLQEHLPIIRQSIPQFKLHCHCYGSPPVFSQNVAEAMESFVTTYINEDDSIARLSFGSVADFKDLLVQASHLVNTKGSQEEKFKILSVKYQEILEHNQTPKLYIGGRIYHIFKVKRVLSHNDKDRYVMERVHDRERFLNFIPRAKTLAHHWPDNIDRSIRKAYEGLMNDQ